MESNDTFPETAVRCFGDLIGLRDIIARLRPLVQQARSRGLPLPHMLYYGNKGLGKKTCATALAAELVATAHHIRAVEMAHGTDLVGVLTKLGPGDLLVVEGFESAAPVLTTDPLFSDALSSYSVNITLDAGVHARTITMPLPPFTAIFLVDDASRLSKNQRSLLRACDLEFAFGPYDDSEISEIIRRAMSVRLPAMTRAVEDMIANCSAGNPGAAFEVLRRAIRLQKFSSAGISTALDPALVEQACSSIILSGPAMANRGLGGQREPIPPTVQIFVWNRDSGRCVRCGSNLNLEFDHMIPLSRGGSNTARNIQLLCEACNRKKSDNIG